MYDLVLGPQDAEPAYCGVILLTGTRTAVGLGAEHTAVPRAARSSLPGSQARPPEAEPRPRRLAGRAPCGHAPTLSLQPPSTPFPRTPTRTPTPTCPALLPPQSLPDTPLQPPSSWAWAWASSVAVLRFGRQAINALKVIKEANIYLLILK